MAKHMIMNSGTVVKVNKDEAARLFISGQASYMSKDEFKRAVEIRSAKSATAVASTIGYPLRADTTGK
jgi:hypothetical protein